LPPGGSDYIAPLYPSRLPAGAPGVIPMRDGNVGQLGTDEWRHAG